MLYSLALARNVWFVFFRGGAPRPQEPPATPAAKLRISGISCAILRLDHFPPCLLEINLEVRICVSDELHFIYDHRSQDNEKQIRLNFKEQMLSSL